MEGKEIKKQPNAKRKGNRIERYYVSLFRQLGFKKCETSRFASRLHDYAKIDLVGIPFNIQIKGGRQRNLSPGKELFLMQQMMIALFEAEDNAFNKPCMLIHHMEKDGSYRRLPEHQRVYMSLKQFEFFKNLNNELTYITKKKYRPEIDSEFGEIIYLNFEDFKNKIIIPHYAKDSN